MINFFPANLFFTMGLKFWKALRRLHTVHDAFGLSGLSPKDVQPRLDTRLSDKLKNHQTGQLLGKEFGE
jgi:hypothetical protein